MGVCMYEEEIRILKCKSFTGLDLACEWISICPIYLVDDWVELAIETRLLERR